MKYSRRLRRILRVRADATHSKNLRSDVAWPDLALAKSLNRQTMARADPVAAMPPGGDERHGDAQLMGQPGSPVGVDEGCKSAHALKFNQTKPAWQAESLVKLDRHGLELGHTTGMNIPWFIKARERVDALGMQRTQFAERMGVSKGLVTQWFQGATTPPFKRFTKMAEVLDMTVAELIADDESFAKNPTEMAALRLVRDLPEDQQPAALALMTTLFRGLKASVAAPPPPAAHQNHTKPTP